MVAGVGARGSEGRGAGLDQVATSAEWWVGRACTWRVQRPLRPSRPSSDPAPLQRLTPAPSPPPTHTPPSPHPPPPPLQLKVWRGGQHLDVPLQLAPARQLVPVTSWDEQPQYFVWAGLVGSWRPAGWHI